MANGTSYLASVKDELRSVVEEIAEMEDASIDQITNRLWRWAEPRLKESFLNGKKAQANGKHRADASRDADTPRKNNPFRK